MAYRIPRSSHEGKHLITWWLQTVTTITRTARIPPTTVNIRSFPTISSTPDTSLRAPPTFYAASHAQSALPAQYLLKDTTGLTFHASYETLIKTPPERPSLHPRRLPIQHSLPHCQWALYPSPDKLLNTKPCPSAQGPETKGAERSAYKSCSSQERLS